LNPGHQRLKPLLVLRLAGGGDGAHGAAMERFQRGDNFYPFGGIALAGWERLGWGSGPGERWMRMRDRRGPLAALLMVAGYAAILLWSQLWVARALGAPVALTASPLLAWLLKLNAWLLGWRIAMRAGFVTATYGPLQGLLSIPRLVVGNVIAMLAVKRAIAIHSKGEPLKWDKTSHIFPVGERTI
jgi:adsorption protein B